MRALSLQHQLGDTKTQWYLGYSISDKKKVNKYLTFLIGQGNLLHGKYLDVRKSSKERKNPLQRYNNQEQMLKERFQFPRETIGVLAEQLEAAD